MLRTNSKKAIENVKNYIMEGFECENYGIEKPDNFKDAANIIMNVFKDEKRYDFKRGLNHQQIFTDWCQGLPSIIDTCYYYNRSAVEDLANILEESEEEKKKYSEEKAESLLTWLIYRELTKATR